MTFSQLTVKSDLIGMLASGLCLLHCIATPLLFVAGTGLGIPTGAQPSWWGYLDPLFLIFSFFAVYWSVKSASQTWVKYVFVGLWVPLLLLVLNEKLRVIEVWEKAIYIPTLGLILLHLYNIRSRHRSNASSFVKN